METFAIGLRSTSSQIIQKELESLTILHKNYKGSYFSLYNYFKTAGVFGLTCDIRPYSCVSSVDKQKKKKKKRGSFLEISKTLRDYESLCICKPRRVRGMKLSSYVFLSGSSSSSSCRAHLLLRSAGINMQMNVQA